MEISHNVMMRTLLKSREKYIFPFSEHFQDL